MLQGQRLSQARHQQKAGNKEKLYSGFLLSLLFNPADGGDVSLRNVD
jgi:hypothetical protein